MVDWDDMEKIVAENIENHAKERVTVEKLNKRIAALEAALRLAANRMHWLALKQETGTLEFIEQNEWVEEARAALENKDTEQ